MKLANFGRRDDAAAQRGALGQNREAVDDLGRRGGEHLQWQHDAWNERDDRAEPNAEGALQPGVEAQDEVVEGDVGGVPVDELEERAGGVGEDCGRCGGRRWERID